MYSDSKKFPNSGGYVWLSDDSRNRYVSVFKGSLFETIIQPPSVLMKMIYHWVCQTSLNNVLTWVKVDHNTIDTFYRHMRCICVATVQEEIINLGGDDKAVELGVISLGTTTTGKQFFLLIIPKINYLYSDSFKNHLFSFIQMEIAER